jgi:hypothetical protein
METLTIEMTPKTPLIQFNAGIGRLEFQGRSIPENSIEFYTPVFDWMDKYALSPQGETQVKIQLEYFNTSSSKCLLDIFKKLQNLHSSGKSNVSINWYYEEDDEDMLEAGEDYQAIIKVPFIMSKI